MSGPIQHKAGGIKARDVEQYIKSMGFEKGIQRVCVELAEQQRALEHTQITVAQTLDQMTDIIMQFSEVAGNMKNAHEDLIKRMQGTDRPDLPSAHGEDN